MQQHLRPLQRLHQRDAKTQFGLQFENVFFQPAPNITGLCARCSSVFGASWLVCVAVNPRRKIDAGHTTDNAITRSALAQCLGAAPVLLAMHDTAEWASLVINIGNFGYLSPAIPCTSGQVFPLVRQPAAGIYQFVSNKFSDFAPDAPLSANAVENILLAQSGLEHGDTSEKKEEGFLQGNYPAHRAAEFAAELEWVALKNSFAQVFNNHVDIHREAFLAQLAPTR